MAKKISKKQIVELVKEQTLELNRTSIWPLKELQAIVKDLVKSKRKHSDKFLHISERILKRETDIGLDTVMKECVVKDDMLQDAKDYLSSL